MRQFNWGSNGVPPPPPSNLCKYLGVQLRVSSFNVTSWLQLKNRITIRRNVVSNLLDQVFSFYYTVYIDIYQILSATRLQTFPNRDINYDIGAFIFTGGLHNYTQYDWKSDFMCTQCCRHTEAVALFYVCVFRWMRRFLVFLLSLCVDFVFLLCTLCSSL